MFLGVSALLLHAVIKSAAHKDKVSLFVDRVIEGNNYVNKL